MKKIGNTLLVLLGLLCTGLGALGVAVPVLPTVPLLLAAAFCFTKGSRRFNEWFRRSRLYKKHLMTFMEERAMTRGQKAWALVAMAVVMISGAVFSGRPVMWVVAVLVIALNIWIFAAKIKTISAGEAKTVKKAAVEEGEAAHEERAGSC